MPPEWKGKHWRDEKGVVKSHTADTPWWVCVGRTLAMRGNFNLTCDTLSPVASSQKKSLFALTAKFVLIELFEKTDESQEDGGIALVC